MNKKTVEKSKKPLKINTEELCPECFKVVGSESRYRLVCFLGRNKDGATVGRLTKELGLRQPTVTHHLNVLRSMDAVNVADRGRERVYTINPTAHCFDECAIPFT